MLKNTGFGRNLRRVIQRADQGLGRAEKTEVLSEDLQNAEKRVEVLKKVLSSLVHKISGSLQAHNVSDTEKRMRKMPSAVLAVSLLENSQTIDGILGDIFYNCAESLSLLGQEQSSHELIVEKSTLEYFQQILDTDIPALKKSKQTLKQLTLDMDSLKSKQQALAKQNAEHQSQSNLSKTESLNSELEEAANKVAMCKDQYATEMLTFLSKETDIARQIIEWMEAQRSYHKKCIEFISDLIPELNVAVDQHTSKPVYGCALEDHLQVSEREIAYVIEVCVSILYHHGLEEEGLFRIAGSASKLKKLKAAFNAGAMLDIEEYYSDVHVVAGALKQYIRELPEPLLTFTLFDEFLSCMSIKDQGQQMQALWTVVNKLPKPNLDNVKYLIKFLARLAERSEVNKMTPGNIAIVFGPNLLWSPNDDSGKNVALSGIQNHIIEILVAQHEYFFPGDVEIDFIENVGFVSLPRAVECGSLKHDNRSRFSNSLTSTSGKTSIASLDREMSTSSTELSTSGPSSDRMSRSTDVVGSLEAVQLRPLSDKKRDKSMRLSFPSAINDKILGKLRSGSKTRQSSLADKKDKTKVKDSRSTALGSRKSSLQGRDNLTADQSLNSIDGEEESITVEDHAEGVTFKPRYTPENEKLLDTWNSGAPDAPLADPEGDDSPLFTEPPTRSFPLSHMPSCYHGDYDTAFALASLQGDCLSYQSQVHSLVEPSQTKTSSLRTNSGDSGADISIPDLPVTFSTHSPSSVKPLLDVKTAKEFSASTEELSVPSPKVTPHKSVTDDSHSTGSTHSNQLNTPITESLTTSVCSPAANRKKKPAPPPPTTQPHRDAPTRPPQPKSPSPATSTHRNEAVKKPSQPPPCPPKNHRPANPPPPCPAPPIPKTPITADESTFLTDNPTEYASTDIIDQTTQQPVQRAKSDSCEPEDKDKNSGQDTVPALTTVSKGHTRAKSHDLRQKVPPPIPQRTNSVSIRQSPTPPKIKPIRPPSIETKAAAGNSAVSTESSDTSTDTTTTTIPTTTATSVLNSTNANSTSATDSTHRPSSATIYINDTGDDTNSTTLEEAKHLNETRQRFNSQSDATAF